LGETDQLWPELRHLHIADSVGSILDKFNEFVSENKASPLTQGGKIESLKDMADAVKKMPQYREMLGKYSLHINLATECMKLFKKRDLMAIAGLEQDMVTGESSGGEQLKTSHFFTVMPPLLESQEIDMKDKLRMLMLYIISQEGVKDADRKRLFEIANISPADQAMIANLSYLGVTLSKGSSKSKPKSDKEKKKKQRKTEDSPPYELSRYVPQVTTLTSNLAENTLSTSEYPFVREASSKSEKKEKEKADTGTGSSLRRGQPRWAEKKSKKGKEEKKGPSGPRIIVFVIGGITYSEIRSAYELTNKLGRQVIVGSDHLIVASEFLDNIRGLKKMETVDS